MGLLATGIALVALWAPPDPEAVRAALGRVLSERSYQTTLPESPSADDEKPDHRPDASPPVDRGRSRRRTGRTASRTQPDEEGRATSHVEVATSEAVATALVWVVLGVLALVLVIWVATEWRGRERRIVPPAARGGAPRAPPVPTVALADVDALATAGRFGEAIHLLLLAAIGVWRAPAAALPASLTSREILSRARFRPGARDVFVGLVDAVEMSLFGGRDVGADAYADCRARFDRFHALEARSGE